MDDLISRQAVISLAKDVCVPTADGSIWRHRCIDPQQIMELPSAQAEPKWIPCSERLPEPNERVLVYTVGKEFHVWDAMPHRAENYAWEDEEGLYHSLYAVDLWMPLPEL